MAKRRNELEQAALAISRKCIELQKRNLAETGRFQEALEDLHGRRSGRTPPDRQKEVRTLMHDLLANPVKPLGGLTAAGAEALRQRDDARHRRAASRSPPPMPRAKATLAAEALTLEGKILRQLSFAMSRGGRGEDRPACFRPERAARDAAARSGRRARRRPAPLRKARRRSGAPLVDAQDRLGGDMAAFLTAGKDEAAQAAQTDRRARRDASQRCWREPAS